MVLAVVIAASLVAGIRVAVAQNTLDSRAMHDSSQGETRM
jgi:hypothetical protein